MKHLRHIHRLPYTPPLLDIEEVEAEDMVCVSVGGNDGGMETEEDWDPTKDPFASAKSSYEFDSTLEYEE